MEKYTVRTTFTMLYFFTFSWVILLWSIGTLTWAKFLDSSNQRIFFHILLCHLMTKSKLWMQTFNVLLGFCLHDTFKIFRRWIGQYSLRWWKLGITILKLKRFHMLLFKIHNAVCSLMFFEKPLRSSQNSENYTWTKKNKPCLVFLKVIDCRGFYLEVSE